MFVDPYGDPDLVLLYDQDNPDGPDHDFFRSLADRLGARTIVDLGCGTGLLTRSLATPGRTVLGVDPSATMLSYAVAQPGADRTIWVHGDATAIPATGDADLVISSGNAMMHVPPAELATTLTSVAASLRPQGSLAFDTRNPARRAWEEWTKAGTLSERVTSFGNLREWIEVTERDHEPGRVVFDAHNVIDGGQDRVYSSVVHFRSPEELEAALTATGFADVEIAGGWHREPVTKESSSLVVTARRT
jgi:SAM-dependent methyltransferase